MARIGAAIGTSPVLIGKGREKFQRLVLGRPAPRQVSAKP
jgi:hypothetical protein